MSGMQFPSQYVRRPSRSADSARAISTLTNPRLSGGVPASARMQQGNVWTARWMQPSPTIAPATFIRSPVARRHSKQGTAGRCLACNWRPHRLRRSARRLRPSSSTVVFGEIPHRAQWASTSARSLVNAKLSNRSLAIVAPRSPRRPRLSPARRVKALPRTTGRQNWTSSSFIPPQPFSANGLLQPPVKQASPLKPFGFTKRIHSCAACLT